MINVEDMDYLVRFQTDLNGETWERVFVKAGGDEHMANHLWSKFSGYDHSIVRLWASLDKGNRERLLKIFENCKVSQKDGFIKCPKWGI